MKRTQLGHVISGSLAEGFTIRIMSGTSLEEIKTGKFVSILGQHHLFFSLITDLHLGVTNPDILLYPPAAHETFLISMLNQRDMYATAHCKPMLMVKNVQTMPVKTIPPHFAPVFEANEHDVSLVFGSEQTDAKYFNIGCPLDMTTPVCIDLEKLTQRSTGIFGKTGTGKTFITRLLLAGLIKQNKAVNLIFDMHSEYGLQARSESGHNHFVKGLKTLFPSSVAIASLDPESTRRRSANPDIELTLTYQDVHVEDILSLAYKLNLHATAVEAAHLIATKYKQDWLAVLLGKGEFLKDFATELGAHPESIAALYRKLKRLERLPFFVERSSKSQSQSSIEMMLEYLNNGISIIIEFGNYTATFVYLLIANIVTRRIHTIYTTKTEQFLGSHAAQDEPRQLMITIEEAHKFLNPSAARQTIFGTIAREMRKYYVSLLIVDQRPSGIDEEILSQIGTKFIAQLNDDKDIQAVLTGARDASSLRSILSSLDSKQQILLLGHAIAMPVVVQTRSYDETFYAALLDQIQSTDIAALVNELF